MIDEIAVAATAGMLLSALFHFVPGLNGAYDALSAQSKALVMLVLNIVVIGGAFGLSCWGPYSYFECTTGGAWGALELLYLVAVGLVGNQAAHSVLKPMAAKAAAM